MSTTYSPRPGTVAYRAIAVLEMRPTAEHTASHIALELGGSVTASDVASSLTAAVLAGAVHRRQRDRTTPRAPWYYSLTDLDKHARLEGHVNTWPWMQRPGDGDVPVFRERGAEPSTDTPKGDQAGSEPAREVMEPEACESAAGRGTNGAPALATLPQHASPGVGPMGAGQPADAGPTEEDLRSGGGGARPAAAGCTGRASSPLIRGPLPGRHSQDAGVATGPLHHQRPVARRADAADEQSAYRRQEPACTGHQSAAQQGNLNPVTDAVEPAAPAALPPVVEQRREVDAQFAATLRAAMDVCKQMDDDARKALVADMERDMNLPPADLAATRRAVRAPHEPAPLAFRAARFSDGSLATERDGVVVAVYSAAEVDAIQKLLGVRG